MGAPPPQTFAESYDPIRDSEWPDDLVAASEEVLERKSPRRVAGGLVLDLQTARKIAALVEKMPEKANVISKLSLRQAAALVKQSSGLTQ